MPKTSSNLHITHKSFSAHKQKVQQGALSWLTQQLCQELNFHTLQKPPKLFPQLYFQQTPGKLKAPLKTRLSDCETSPSCLENISSASSAWLGCL